MSEEHGIGAVLDMLEAVTIEDGVSVFEHSAEEIGIAVMENHRAVAAALAVVVRNGERA